MNFHLNDATVEKLTSCVAVEKQDEVRSALKMLQDKTPLSQDVFVEVSKLLSWDQNPALREALEEDKEKVRILQALQLQRDINTKLEGVLNGKTPLYGIETLSEEVINICRYKQSPKFLTETGFCNRITSGLQNLQKQALETQEEKDLQTRKQKFLEKFQAGKTQILATIHHETYGGGQEEGYHVCHDDESHTFAAVNFLSEKHDETKVFEIGTFLENLRFRRIYGNLIFTERTDKKCTKPVIQTIRISNNFGRRRPEMTEWEEIYGDVSFYGSTYQVLYDYGGFKIKNPARDKENNREEFYLASDPTTVEFIKANGVDFVIVTEKDRVVFVSCQSGKRIAILGTNEPFQIIDGVVTLSPVGLFRKKPNPNNFKLSEESAVVSW